MDAAFVGIMLVLGFLGTLDWDSLKKSRRSPTYEFEKETELR